MTCRAARRGLPLVGSSRVQELNAEIDWLTGQIANLRASLTAYEAELAGLIRARKEQTMTPAPGAGEKETT